MEKGNNMRDLVFLRLVPIPATTSRSICWAPGRGKSVQGHAPAACPPLVPPQQPHCCPLGMAPASTGPCKDITQHLPHPLQLARRTRPTSTPTSTHIVVVLPAPLCPRKDTTWFS